MSRLLVVTVALSALVPFATPQTSKPAAKTQSGAAAKFATSANHSAQHKLKVPGPQRELALRLLSEAEAETGVLDPAGRTGLLYLLGQTYAAFDKPKARELLEFAYQSSRVAYEQRPDAVRFMLFDLVTATVQVAPDVVEHSLPEEKSSRDTALRLLVKNYVARKDLNRAIELMLSMSSDESMTYAAIDLLRALPSSRQHDRDRVFAGVLNAYKQSKHYQVGTGSPEDLGTLIVRFHNYINRALVREAIDELLREAKSIRRNVIMSTAQRTITFSSYQFRLFQLLPALRQIDPEHADSLLKEETETASLLKQYPDGQRSADTSMRDTPLKDGEIRQVSFAYASGRSSTAVATRMEIDRTVEEFARRAETDPNSAIANAALMSDGVVRTKLLLAVARTCQEKNPTAAKAALRRILSSPPENPDTYNQIHDAAELAHQFGDKDLAKGLIEAGLKRARALYDFESDNDDPHWALKLNWVSVQAYRDFLKMQVKLAPDSALQHIKDLPDPELRALEKVMLAAALLNAPLSDTSPIQKAPKAQRSH